MQLVSWKIQGTINWGTTSGVQSSHQEHPWEDRERGINQMLIISGQWIFTQEISIHCFNTSEKQTFNDKIFSEEREKVLCFLSILNIFFPFRPHRLFPIQHHQYTPYEYIIPCAIITSLHLLSSHSSNSKKKLVSTTIKLF